MKKETFTEKFAKKAFESSEIQKSWQTHIQAFGPILEPVFVENYKARVRLTAALNSISNYNVKAGLKKLEEIQDMCVTDADKAVVLFCLGLCFDMANMKEEMVAYYMEASKFGHKFYLPYLKVAKTAHNDAVFEVAKENYIKAIECLEADELSEQKRIILGSVYANYASCLTMMHCYEEAEEALQNSHKILPELSGRLVTEAILEAAKGNSEKAYLYVKTIQEKEPSFYGTTNMMIKDILDNKHPHFAGITLSEECIKAFWDWFVLNEKRFLETLEAQNYDAFFQEVQCKLKEVFPFMERDLEVGIEPKEDLYQITFADFFMISLEQGYKDLIESAPQSLIESWRFYTAH